MQSNELQTSEAGQDFWEKFSGMMNNPRTAPFTGLIGLTSRRDLDYRINKKRIVYR